MKARFQNTGSPNLYIKGGMYYYRRQMTGPIFKHLGIREVRRSLRTRNLSEARLRCAQVDICIKTILGDTEKMLSKNISPEALAIAREYFNRELQDCMDQLELTPVQMKSITGEPITHNREKQASIAHNIFKKYSKMANSNTFDEWITKEVEDGFYSIGEEVPKPSSPKYRMLGSMLCRAHAEAHRIYYANLSEKFSDVLPQDPLFITEQGPISIDAIQSSSKTLLEFINDHREAKKDTIVISSQQDFERLYSWLLEWFGKGIQIHNITKKHILGFRDALHHMPKNYIKLKGYKNLPLKKVIEKSKKAKKVTYQGISTQKKYLSLLKALFSWGVEEDYLTISPAKGVKIIVTKNTPAKVTRLPYTKSDVRKILYSPLFTGYKNFKIKSEAGPIKLQTDDYWAWLIGFLSGLRIKEITLLHRRDIREVEGILCFDVNNDHGKGVKTLSSIRLVPIHKKLIELGLLEWMKKTTKGKPNNLVFPTLIGKQEKDPSKRATSRLNNYRKKFGFTSSKKTLHSTRHTIADELRDQNVQEYSISKTLGHTEKGTTPGYGSGTSLKVLKGYIDNCYSDFDFEPLKQMK